MEEILENILKKTSNNRFFSYQNIAVFLLSTLEMISGFIVIALGYLEVWPKVDYIDSSGYQHKDITLDYDLCNNGTLYTIVDNKRSLILDFDLVCKKFEISLIGTLYFVGVLVGSFLSHYLSDYFGRKKTLLIFSVVLVLIQLIFSINSNVIIFYVLLFISGILYILIALSGVVLMNESIDKDKRSMFTSVIYLGFSVGGIIYSILFEYIDNWRNVFYVVLGINVLVFMSFWYFFVESPRFFLSKGLENEFKNAILYMAKVSGSTHDFEEDFRCKNILVKLFFNRYLAYFNHESYIKLKDNNTLNNVAKQSISDEGEFLNSKPTKVIESVEVKIDNDSKTEKLINKSKRKEFSEYTLFDLVLYKSQRYNFLILCFVWLVNSIIFYFLNINIKNLSGNQYMFGMLLFSLDIVIVVAFGFISNTELMGRKKSLLLLTMFSLLSSIFCFVCIVVIADKQKYELLVDIGLLVCRLSTTSTYCIVYFMSNEIYPTALRAKGLAINSLIARIGGIIAPIIIDSIDIRINLTGFIVLNSIAFVILFKIQETYNRPLKQVPEEEEDKE